MAKWKSEPNDGTYMRANASPSFGTDVLRGLTYSPLPHSASKLSEAWSCSLPEAMLVQYDS